MKRYGLIIFTLLFLSSIGINATPLVNKKASAVLALPASQSFSNTNPSFPNEEVELAAFNGNTVMQGHHGVQKDLAFPHTLIIRGVVNITDISLTSYAPAQLFRNTCLYYNYPSHNFW